MPGFGFKDQFVDAVERGWKKQTIRPFRKDKRIWKPGDPVYLFANYRTPQCRRIGVGQICISEVVQIGSDGARTMSAHDPNDPWEYFLETGPAWKAATGHPRDDFAKLDGFDSFAEMREWFDRQHGLPFTGTLYSWELIKPRRVKTG